MSDSTGSLCSIPPHLCVIMKTISEGEEPWNSMKKKSLIFFAGF